MEIEEELLNDLSEKILRTFFFNKDIYAVQEREKNGKIVYYTKYQKLNKVKIKSALKNKRAYMSYQQKLSNLKWICMDFDIKNTALDYNFFNDEVYKEKLIEEVKIATKKLDELKIKYVIEFSGNRGIHIWIFFDTEVTKSIGFLILSAIMETIEFKYIGKENSNIEIDRYPKNGNGENNSRGIGVKIPCSYHLKSNRYSYLLEDIDRIENITELTNDLIENQINIIDKVERNDPFEIIDNLQVEIKHKGTHQESDLVLEQEYTLEEILEMLKKSQIFKILLEKPIEELTEKERVIITGTLNRIYSSTNRNYGKDLLIEFFSKAKNYDKEKTEKKLEKLRNLYPPLISYAEKQLNISCQYCKENNIIYTTQLIDGIKELKVNKENDFIKWCIYAEKDYLNNNDEVPHKFIDDELDKLDINEIKDKITKIEEGRIDSELEKTEIFKYIRKEEDKDRIMYQLSAKDKIVSTVVMFIIDDYIKSNCISTNSYSYKLNKFKYKNATIFEPWNTLWMSYQKEISDKIFDEDYNDYYILKLDLKHFYDSINIIFLRDILYNRPEEIVQVTLKNMSEEEKKIYKNLCEYLIRLSQKVTNNNKGVPQGPAFARYLAESYISRIDKIIEKKLKNDEEFYYRYVDDIVIIVETKEKAEEILEIIGKELEKIDLQLNNDKKEFGQVKKLKYKILNNDIGKYFIDNCGEDTPEHVINTARKLLRKMFKQIENKEEEEIDYKNVPFFMTHLIDKEYLRAYLGEIIESITNSKKGRGSMFKHFYKNVVFNEDFLKDINLEFYNRIEGESRANFIDQLNKNAKAVDKKILQEIVETYLQQDLEIYEKIQLYSIILENELPIKMDNEAILYRCIKNSSQLNIENDILESVFAMIQKEEDCNKRAKVIEDILSKLKSISVEANKSLVNIIYMTIQKENINYDINEIYQVVFNIMAYMTLYDDRKSRIDEVWEKFLPNAKQKSIDINTEDWYRYETLISQNKCEEPTIIQYITKELSEEDTFTGEDENEYVLKYISSLMMFFTGEKLLHNINDDDKKTILKLAKKHNIKVIEWCLEDGSTCYFPDRETALKNIQYNDRIVMKKENNLIIRGNKEILSNFEEQFEENISIDGRSRYYSIVSIENKKLKSIDQIIEGMNVVEAILKISKVYDAMEQRKKTYNLFEKGVIDENGNIEFGYSAYDKQFILKADQIIINSEENLAKEIINLILTKDTLQDLKLDLGQEYKVKELANDFIPDYVKTYKEKLEFLFQLSKKMEQNIDCRIVEKAKIETIMEASINVKNVEPDYSKNYTLLAKYNYLKGEEENKLLYGKVDIDKRNLKTIIETIKNSISKNQINSDYINKVKEQLEHDLNRLKTEYLIDIEKADNQYIEVDTDIQKIIIDDPKYNIEDYKIIEFAKKTDSLRSISQKELYNLIDNKYLFLYNNYIIRLPEFLEKVLDIIDKKQGKYDIDEQIRNTGFANVPYYHESIQKIITQNNISKREAEIKLYEFLKKKENKYHNCIVEVISNYKVMEDEEISKFINGLKNKIEDQNTFVIPLNDYQDIDEKDGVDAMLTDKGGKDFERGAKFSEIIRKNLEKRGSIESKGELLIFSDIGISGSQFSKKIPKEILEEFERKYKSDNVKIKVTILNCLYTSKYEDTVNKELKNFEFVEEVEFEGVKIDEKYYFNNLNPKIRREFKEFLNTYEDSNKKDYIEELEENDVKNLLVARYKSMPKKRIKIFDDKIFNYRKEKSKKTY